jgi:hypothetical protein
VAQACIEVDGSSIESTDTVIGTDMIGVYDLETHEHDSLATLIGKLVFCVCWAHTWTPMYGLRHKAPKACPSTLKKIS